MGHRTRFDKDRWIGECAGLIRNSDEHLTEHDAFELATALWERPSIRGFDPDMVAAVVLSKRYDRSLWGRLASHDRSDKTDSTR